MMDNETRAAFRMGKLANDSGLTPEQVFQKVQADIREEKQLATDREAALYWVTLSYVEKLEFVERALKEN